MNMLIIMLILIMMMMIDDEDYDDDEVPPTLPIHDQTHDHFCYDDFDQRILLMTIMMIIKILLILNAGSWGRYGFNR